jgi:hypothetical protein
MRYSSQAEQAAILGTRVEVSRKTDGKVEKACLSFKFS